MPPHYYERIAELSAKLNTFITVLPNATSENPNGPLAGMAVGVKDIIDTAGVLTTAGSAMFADRVPTQDADVVSRIKQAGAVIIGKTNTHEFAFGPTGAISHFGPARNPFNPQLITGGSSSGSAAAVASGMCDVALGTDTGGSIRIPAALCGVVGLKPTFNKVSVKGIIQLAPTLDHAGPLARNVADAARLYEVLAGEKVELRDVAKIRVGVVRDYFFGDLDSEVAYAVEAAIAKCRAAGWEVSNATLPCKPDFDRYSTLGGYEVYQVHQQWLRDDAKAALYQPLTRDRLKLVANITKERYDTALAQTLLERREIEMVFSDLDVLLTPTVAVQAPRVDDALTDGFRILLRNTSPFNMWGIPAISIPCGKTKVGMPIGLQLAAANHQESLLLSVAHCVERLLG